MKLILFFVPDAGEMYVWGDTDDSKVHSPDRRKGRRASDELVARKFTKGEQCI